VTTKVKIIVEGNYGPPLMPSKPADIELNYPLNETQNFTLPQIYDPDDDPYTVTFVFSGQAKTFCEQLQDNTGFIINQKNVFPGTYRVTIIL
jgi:hypothetical protein